MPADFRSRQRLGHLLLAGALALVACDEDETPAPLPAASGPAAAEGLAPLSAEELRTPLAQVGDHTITLGEFVETLERMDPFERLRYQSTDRRRELLNEMIELELLAQEAERRGLDKLPETQLRINQALRDEVLEKLKRSLPALEELPESELRAYYEKHREEFREPERRRVLHLVVASQKLARELAEKLQGADGAAWAAAAREHSLDRRGFGADESPELAGDLGLVSAPGDERGENPRVPEPLRKAVFALEDIGDVAEEPVEAGGRYHLVRLGGKSPARDRSFTDAERLVRVEVLRQKFLDAERRLEAELREKYPVVIDEKAIAGLSTSPEKPSPQGTSPQGTSPQKSP